MAGNALKEAEIQFEDTREFPKSLNQLLEQAKMRSSSGGTDRILFESIDLKIGENIVHILDGGWWGFEDMTSLSFHLVNKEDPSKWFWIMIGDNGEQHPGIMANMNYFTFEEVQVRFKFYE